MLIAKEVNFSHQLYLLFSIIIQVELVIASDKLAEFDAYQSDEYTPVIYFLE